MRICHYKKTKVASAPDEISKGINKYSDCVSEVFHDHANTFIQDLNKYDIIHFHNVFYNVDKKSLIQYHSEPFRVYLNFKGTKLVISQYHATLPEYKDCKIVRNLINFETDLYKPNIIKNKIKVGFSPSVTENCGVWYDKGYEETSYILNKLKQNNKNFEFDIITGVPLEECIQRKSDCNIIIDECMTPSFHRSGLEGLALGKLTICSTNEPINDVMKKASGSEIIPFHSIWINNLEKDLQKIIDKGIDFILKEGEASRTWIETYWHPKQIVDEYVNIYKGL